MEESMKYVKFINLDVTAGLLHHTNNLIRIIKKSYLLGKIPIIPQFSMTCKNCGNGFPEPELGEWIHDNPYCKKEERSFSNFSEWCDFDKLKLNGEPYEVVIEDDDISDDDIFVFDLEEDMHGGNTGVLSKWPEFNTKEMKEIILDLPFKERSIDIAQKITSKLGKYVCVHVRRADYRADSVHRKLYTILYQNYCLPPYNRYEKADEATQSENILNTLNSLVDNSYNVYLMTDEGNLEMFSEIKKEYNVFFYTDFEELKEMREDDNFLLFTIELLLMSKANKKISTFNRGYFQGTGFNSTRIEHCDAWLYQEVEGDAHRDEVMSFVLNNDRP